tara:strand:+ start:777 stop:983 length:207 start_codon:yes stop_codon:yes gene_type:complete
LDQSKTKERQVSKKEQEQLIEALGAMLYATSQLRLEGQINLYVNEETGQGAFDYALGVLFNHEDKVKK